MVKKPGIYNKIGNKTISYLLKKRRGTNKFNCGNT